MRMPGVGEGKGNWLVQGLFRLMERRPGGVPAPLRIYGWRPAILRAFLGLGRAVRRPGALPERLKRLAMFRTARLVDCAF
jgi:hypothetical protein